MVVKLPQKVKYIIDTLTEHGYEAYAVGGCVRDSVLGRIPEDWDITTSAKPDQVKEIFRRSIDTGIVHGTVTVIIANEGFEVTTYRIDGEYEDSRHPKEVTFTACLEEDLKRRDFTINAMAYNESQGIVDKFEGLEDLKKGIIRCVGNAEERFQEDALRMLRAVRFSAQLGFDIDEMTKEAIKCLAPALSRISAERIQVELVKLLISDHPEQILTAYQTGITKVILPEFDTMMETPQNTPHHKYCVGEHTVKAMQGIKADKVLRLTMLLHDVAKPACRTVDKAGIDHFYRHPQKGSEMATEILKRLKFDNETIRYVSKLVYWHDDQPKLTMAGIRKAIYKVGEDIFPLLFMVKFADIHAQSDYHQEEKQYEIKKMMEIYEKIIEQKDCISLKDLAVSGKDLIEEGIKPGKEIGNLLNKLLMIVIEDPSKNERQQLISYVRELNKAK
ncbi:CCA tRNA nucleotidyltransferase [Anaerosacchariphilus polymeriproducens]|uniref:CCA tRNA nucleotidyltransferase n=1 Tax=Anaerosacchariphilus polymeriproducens TaxID=1812858 RepID=A0A371AY23_9FIRM|nr:CCA tRNA nucleotidyltransferase [Anaerosacchariphilus polymeriproducens]RDU24478.1 CCA tRNA nucleotidyltransferase [Anaerosacchariphilus polymeriproducens]